MLCGRRKWEKLIWVKRRWRSTADRWDDVWGVSSNAFFRLIFLWWLFRSRNSKDSGFCVRIQQETYYANFQVCNLVLKNIFSSFLVSVVPWQCLPPAWNTPVSLKKGPTPDHPVRSDWSSHECLSQNCLPCVSSRLCCVFGFRLPSLSTMNIGVYYGNIWHGDAVMSKVGLPMRRFRSSVFCGRR